MKTSVCRKGVQGFFRSAAFRNRIFTNSFVYQGLLKLVKGVFLMAKVIVAGAGAGGLNAAYELGKKGYEVVVIEKDNPETISYNWPDDVERGVIDKMNLVLPQSTHFKADWTFIAPFNTAMLKIKQDDAHRDYSVMRNEFANMLAERAGNAEFHYDTAVTAPILSGDAVIGVKTDKGDFFADIVIDNLGVYSPLKLNLPDSFGIENKVNPKEMFSAYRAFFERTDAPKSEHTNKAYVKHLGNEGISWCLDRGGCVDILVGRVELATEKFVENALSALRKDNPCLGEKLLKGGKIHSIPVRFPLTKAVADGYAALGDSAFMTIPMLGSGLASSLLAGKILADTIASVNAPYTTEKLWAYQTEFYKSFGVKHAAVDYLKRTLLKMKDSDVSFLLSSGLLSADDMATAATGEIPAITFKEKLTKIKAGYKKPMLLLKLNSLLQNSARIQRIAAEIPKVYNKSAAENWGKRLTEAVNSADK